MTSGLFDDLPDDLPDDPPPSAHCPTCDRSQFEPISGSDKWRCVSCRWLVRFEHGRAVDAVNWRVAGRKGAR